MIYQIAKKQWSQNKSDPTLDLPFISIDFIMNLWELQLFKLDDHTKENLKTYVDEINSKTEEWIKLQAVFIFIYNKVIVNTLMLKRKLSTLLEIKRLSEGRIFKATTLKHSKIIIKKNQKDNLQS